MIWFWPSTATDSSWPAAKPFCCNWLTCGVPLDLANWVRPLVPKLSWTLPRLSPFTVRFCSVTLEMGGVNSPLELNVNMVPTFCHAASVPVAFELL